MAPRVHPMTRWHRLLGIVSGLIVIVTTVSGIALNHTDDWQLGRRVVTAPLLNAHYGVERLSAASGYAVESGWVIQVGSRVYRNAHEFYRRDARLRGAVIDAGVLLLAFDDQVAAFNADGELIETYGELDGLALPLSGIAAGAAGVVVDSADGAMLLDQAAGTWRAAAAAQTPNWQTSAPVPAALVAAIDVAYSGTPLSYERVLLDLHSGRILGPVGVLVVDVAALALLLLALSGFYMWFKFKRGAPPGRRPGGGPPP